MLAQHTNRKLYSIIHCSLRGVSTVSVCLSVTTESTLGWQRIHYVMWARQYPLSSKSIDAERRIDVLEIKRNLSSAITGNQHTMGRAKQTKIFCIWYNNNSKLRSCVQLIVANIYKQYTFIMDHLGEQLGLRIRNEAVWRIQVIQRRPCVNSLLKLLIPIASCHL